MVSDPPDSSGYLRNSPLATVWRLRNAEAALDRRNTYRLEQPIGEVTEIRCPIDEGVLVKTVLEIWAGATDGEANPPDKTPIYVCQGCHAFYDSSNNSSSNLTEEARHYLALLESQVGFILYQGLTPERLEKIEELERILLLPRARELYPKYDRRELQRLIDKAPKLNLE